jgi:hypothetical protein
MPNPPAHNLDYVLAGMSYPATYWQILAWADYNCANTKLRTALWRLPDRTYLNQPAIAAALWEQPGGAAACCPPPRTSVPTGQKSWAAHDRGRTRAEIRWIA